MNLPTLLVFYLTAIASFDNYFRQCRLNHFEFATKFRFQNYANLRELNNFYTP